MNKQTVIILILIVLVLLGVGGVYVMKQSQTKSPSPQAMTTPAVSPTAAPQGTQGTLKGLFASTTPQSCTFTTQNSTTTGTMYVGNKQMAGDFTTKKEGNTVTAHLIVQSGYSYLWTDMVKVGVKIALSDAQNMKPADTQGIGMNEAISYDCKPWTVDATKFTLPSGITFTAFHVPSGAMPGSSPASSSGSAPSSSCSACDNIPAGPAQTACKTQLHCM